MNDLTTINGADIESMDESMFESILNEASGVKTKTKFKSLLFKAQNGEFLVETDELNEEDKKVYKEIKNPVVQFLKIRKKISNKKDDDTFYSNEFDGDRTTIYGENKEVLFEGSIWDILGKNGKNQHLKERFSNLTVAYVYCKYELEGKKEEGYFKMYLSWTKEKELNSHIEKLGGKALALYPVRLGLGLRLKASKGEETRPATENEIKRYNEALENKKAPGDNLFYSLKISLIKTNDGGLLQASKQDTVIRIKNVLQYIEAINSIINQNKEAVDEFATKEIETGKIDMATETEEEASESVRAGMEASGVINTPEKIDKGIAEEINEIPF